jgi:hypothetical protein
VVCLAGWQNWLLKGKGEKWMLARDFVEYEHSSASFYEIQLARHYRTLHFLDL